MTKRHLAQMGVSAKTELAYRKAVSRFFVYLQRLNLPLPQSFEELDLLVAEYINELFQEGDSVTYAGYLISGLKRYVPRCRYELHTAAVYFRNWRKNHIYQRATPLPADVLQAMAAAAASVGHWDLACCILLGFSFFLRTAEIMSLRVMDIGIFTGGTLAVALSNTKTSGNNSESMHLVDARLCSIIERALRGRKRDDLIYTRSRQCFRDDFHSLINILMLNDMGFSPYSLRRGGATYFFVASKSFDATVHRGRWLDITTARIYISDSQAHLIRLELPELSRQLVSELRNAWPALVPI